MQRCTPQGRVRKGRERAIARHGGGAAQHARARCQPRYNQIHPRTATRAFDELVHRATRRSGHRLCLPPTPHTRRGRSKITDRRACVRVPRAARASPDPPTRHVLPPVNSSHGESSRGAEVLLRPATRRTCCDRGESREQDAIHRPSKESPGAQLVVPRQCAAPVEGAVWLLVWLPVPDESVAESLFSQIMLSNRPRNR